MNNEDPKHNPQKKVWEDERETKIRRCGRGGYMFKVKAVKKHLEIK